MADIEKTAYEKHDFHDISDSPPYRHGTILPPDDSGAVHGESFTAGNSFYAKFQRLAARFRVELRGIERVPTDERTDKHVWKVGTMWCAANMVVSSLAIGVLAVPVFYLGFVDALLTIFFINCLGAMPVAFFSTFGPRFGLRQMVLSRFWFGYYGVKLIALFNCLACLGWSSVNVIVGSQLLHAVNPAMPGWAGIIVIAAGTFIITCFGYKVVHYYEMISWVPCLIIFLIILGVFAHTGDFSNLPMGRGEVEAGSILSFAASVFGFATGWTSYASDYTCYQPVNTSRTKIFIWVYGALILTLTFTEALGLAIATATVNNPAYAAAYADNAIGGLLAEVLIPHLGTFGKFCLVIVALSIIGNNCPNIYSISFSVQILTHYAQYIPRFVWTFVATLIYCAIAIPGYSHFESVLENFMLVIAYWLAIYEAISLPEHFIFRGGFSGYAPETYDQPAKLPPSFAALFAFCCGIAGAVVGMAQVWWLGPIGGLIGGEFGGDVGFELAFGFAFVSYCCARYFEKRYFGR
ncbi:Purine-cytosine permease fcy21 [Knufia obscura]|uniref:Purine-cytosine permease fcy21 n=2 Tax=Knufia TaxID=430999 RepID=A0AAN8I2M2_9EURO|nr:Purine-cytosine permease fcy21 [Knufia obscura]KAK5951542.1 Purine-cytosine permease fcy21 [Knufia fluminis]